MIVITTINSTKVKPRRRFIDLPAPFRTGLLPLRIRRSIRCLILRLTVYVKHALTAPTQRLGVVLVAAQAPFGLARERVHRDAAEEPHLLAVRSRQLHALYQNLE